MPRFRLRDGGELHHERLDGRAPAILLLHGVLRSSAAWRGVAQRLHDAGRAVLLVDDRGHGASSREFASWAPEHAARDAAELLDAVEPAGVHAVGHSRGGTAAAWLAVERPDLARSLAVVATPPQGSEVFRAHFRDLEPRDERERAAFAELSRLQDDAWPAEALRRYRGRALVVEAEDDPLYSPTHTLFWRAFLPYADFERVPGGHEFFTESPEKEAWLAQRLLRFAEEADRGG